MSDDERLQKNIRRTTGLHAIKQLQSIVDEESNKDAETARILRSLLRYGWIVLVPAAVLLAHFIGVY